VKHIVLCGDDRLSSAIEKRLVQAGCSIARLLRDEAFEIPEGSLEGASTLVIASNDDPGNVDLALTARRLRPDLPIVVRLFDDALVAHIRDTLGATTILSMSALVAPAFADATLRAIATRETRQVTARPRRSVPARVVRLDRVVVSAIAGLVLILGFFTVFFAHALRLSYIDAMYFVWTTVTTVGYGDIALRESSTAVKVAGMVLMFAGAAFLAILFGLFTDRVVARRLEILSGRVSVRGSGHIVIAGGGNIGLRVAARLRERGERIVVVERDADNRNVEALRSAGHHVILADAARPDILQLARTDDAAAILCLTDSDAINFQIALLVRASNASVPLVMRVVSPDLSAHVSERGGAIAISPIAIASEEFASAAMR
jgi:Trk K+ transport system NAD-binding subunit